MGKKVKNKNQEKILFYGKSDMGLVRTNNEDIFVVKSIWDKRTVLAVVIDGVGGYDGGEVAADIACTKISEYLSVSPNGERIELLKQAVTSANNAIYKSRIDDGKYPNMSCVLTAAIIDVERKEINMAHVGDTRLYCYHDGTLKKLSHDHSLVGYREEIGDLTEEEAMRHPQRNIINRVLGSEKHKTDDREFIESEVFPLLPNTILLLCSDGLTDLVTSAMISEVLGQNITLEKKVQNLIDIANNEGGTDNVTVVLVDYMSDEKETEHIILSPIDGKNHTDEDVTFGNVVDGKTRCCCVWKWIVGIAIMLIALVSAFFCGYYSGVKDGSENHMQYAPYDIPDCSCEDCEDYYDSYYYWLNEYYHSIEDSSVVAKQ